MRSEPSRPEMPRYSVQADAGVVPITPPFSFEGMTARVFPLRANLNSLNRFCDRYLNFVPPEIGRFRAPWPFINLMLLNYGRMAVEVANTGWLAQREIVFSVPLEWYRLVNGRWVFHDWATIAPFIYVDDDMSTTVGRTVYGWPKTIARLEATESAWMQDPLAPIAEATVSTMVFPELYRGLKLEEGVFLEIERDAPLSLLRAPFDPRTPFAPWMLATRMAESFTGLARDLVGSFAGMGIMPPHPASDPRNYLAMYAKLGQWSLPLNPGNTASTLNLKQFRSSQNPDQYCFQALTNGPMRFTSINRFGMLGEQSILAGDLSGGFSIRLHRWPNLPIFETLGLEPARRWAGAGAEVIQLKPVLPYWYDVNMEYLQGYNVAWRSQDPTWRDRSGRRFPGWSPADNPEKEKRFNTTLGASNKALAGPYRFTGMTVRVLPLLAKRDRLNQLLDQYLNEPLESASERFSLWAPDLDGNPQDLAERLAYVYLTATVYGEVTSTTNNVGDWADAEIAFLIPVRRERRSEEGKWEVCGVGLVPSLICVDTATAAAAGAEVLGLPSIRAIFVRPESAWMTQVEPGAEGQQMLLRVDTEVLPAVGEGQPSQIRTVLSITAGEMLDPEKTPELADASGRWAALLKQELRRKKCTAYRPRTHQSLKYLRALALEILADREPVTLFTLKQLRDVSEPNAACYQSLVGIHRHLSKVLDLREIELPLVVRIQESPGLRLVSTLGLIGTPVPGDGLGKAYALQPIRPFWVRLSMDEDLGQRLLYRSGSLTWTREKEKPGTQPGTFLCGRNEVDVRTELSAGLDYGDARRLVPTVVGTSADVDLVPVEAIRLAIRCVDPQLVLESILSREWGNYDERARWRTHRRRLAQILEEDAGQPGDEFLTSIMDENGVRPGQPRIEDLQSIRANLRRLDRLLARMDRARAKLRRAWPRGGTDEAGSLAEAGQQYRSAVQSLLETLIRFSRTRIVGTPCSPDSRAGHDVDGNHSRFETLARDSFAPLLRGLKNADRGEVRQSRAKEPDRRTSLEEAARDTLLRQLLREPHSVAGRVPQTWREGMRLARERVQMQRDALLSRLARAFQKPDYVIRRDWAGAERDRLFPIEESWDEQWYYGRSPGPRECDGLDHGGGDQCGEVEEGPMGGTAGGDRLRKGRPDTPPSSPTFGADPPAPGPSPSPE